MTPTPPSTSSSSRRSPRSSSAPGDSSMISSARRDVRAGRTARGGPSERPARNPRTTRNTVASTASTAATMAPLRHMRGTRSVSTPSTPNRVDARSPRPIVHLAPSASAAGPPGSAADRVSSNDSSRSQSPGRQPTSSASAASVRPSGRPDRVSVNSASLNNSSPPPRSTRPARRHSVRANDRCRVSATSSNTSGPAISSSTSGSRVAASNALEAVTVVSPVDRRRGPSTVHSASIRSSRRSCSSIPPTTSTASSSRIRPTVTVPLPSSATTMSTVASARQPVASSRPRNAGRTHQRGDAVAPGVGRHLRRAGRRMVGTLGDGAGAGFAQVNYSTPSTASSTVGGSKPSMARNTTFWVPSASGSSSTSTTTISPARNSLWSRRSDSGSSTRR